MAMAATSPPGWFGKLPGIGDFAHRRWPDDFLAQWDDWLQQGLMHLRERHEADWVERYLEGPLWFFLLGEGIASEKAWIGVLMPSVDSVGRYFPFTIAAELDTPGGLSEDEASVRMRKWWSLAAQAALEGLEKDLDATGFDAALTRLFGTEVPVPETAQPVRVPRSGQSSWCCDPDAYDVLPMIVHELPQGDRFDVLFGFEAEAA
ncbi:type VI secretion system-associated protein TagF [Variovorax rhizosphaerae]|uniref:Type VI secretion system-associated protein TagF n=1 Tax=Variovorax rhizosphaerae TaxID=1836200 RepID=A0ABU8WP79_9BURK